MHELEQDIRNVLRSHGADLVGFGDLTALTPEIRENMPVGVAVAVKLPKDVVRGIAERPTAAYEEAYYSLNDRLDALATLGAEALRARGYEAVAQTRAFVEQFETDYASRLPHKTVATRAGLGWIGKCALLITEEFGSMIRLSSILTNAPLETAEPVNMSKCGSCTSCQNACPAGAVSGKLWDAGTPRDAFFDARACRKEARRISAESLNKEISLCGKCILACPYTRRYLKKEA